MSVRTGPTLALLHEAGVLGPGDLAVTATIGRLTGEQDPDVLLAIALAVRAPRVGHVCLEISRVRSEGLAAEGQAPIPFAWPDEAGWLAAIAASPAVRHATEPRDRTRPRPLVLDGARVYLDRYRRYEDRLVEALQGLLGPRTDRDPAAVAAELDRLFGPAGDEPDLQRTAVQTAAERTLTVLTGGPGTGKTTTVVRLLALLWTTAPDAVRPRIVLAAPTGKAAARMAEALRDALGALDGPPGLTDALRSVPAVTLHRLLGWRADAPTRFRHTAAHPLPYDVVVVDEASMASLPLVAKLVDALAPGTRLVLVGDRNQLTSIEAGAVLSDICGPRVGASGSTGGSTGDASGSVTTALAASIVHLTRFHRFGSDSGIGTLARAINQVDGDASAVIALLRGAGPTGPRHDDITLIEPAEGSDEPMPSTCRDTVVTGYAHAMRLAIVGRPPEEVLAEYGRLRVLTALRRGPQGVEALNRHIEAWLVAAVEGYDAGHGWPLGRPVMVTRNDYDLGLFNGDVGVVVADPDDPEGRRVAFPSADGGVRLVSPLRLSAVESVYAMSIHKSQGSQFDRVVVILPTINTPLLSRELVYTGVTRARDAVTLVASEAVLGRALQRPVQRASGLVERLWGVPRP
jgi:exodeoxyribonuclease V alpha subunit